MTRSSCGTAPQLISLRTRGRPRAIGEIGLTDRLLAKGLAQLCCSGDKLLGTRDARLPHVIAILHGTGIGGELAHRGRDLKQLRSGVLLRRREAIAGTNLLGHLFELKRQVKLGGAGRIAQRGEIARLVLGSHNPGPPHPLAVTKRAR